MYMYNNNRIKFYIWIYEWFIFNIMFYKEKVEYYFCMMIVIMVMDIYIVNILNRIFIK